jgi:hypothetical protein
VFPTGFDIYENALPLEAELFEGIDRLLWYPSTTIINVVDREYGESYGVAHPDATLHKVAHVFPQPLQFVMSVYLQYSTSVDPPPLSLSLSHLQ